MILGVKLPGGSNQVKGCARDCLLYVVCQADCPSCAKKAAKTGTFSFVDGTKQKVPYIAAAVGIGVLLRNRLDEI